MMMMMLMMLRHKIWEPKSGLRILESENHSPTKGRIQATDLELGNPNTHLDSTENPQTQALFGVTLGVNEFCASKVQKVYIFKLQFMRGYGKHNDWNSCDY